MLNFINIIDCENKIFKTSFESIDGDSIILIFEDCYTCLTTSFDDDEDKTLIVNQNLNLLNDCYEENLVENNIYTQEEIEAQKKENEKRFMDLRKAEYLKLKAIFDPS